MNKQRGLAQIPIILGLMLMSIAIPVASRLVSQNQTNQGQAANRHCCMALNCGGSCQDMSSCSGQYYIDCGVASSPNPTQVPVCVPSCAYAVNTCKGQRVANGCGGWCDGLKDCAQTCTPDSKNYRCQGCDRCYTAIHGDCSEETKCTWDPGQCCPNNTNPPTAALQPTPISTNCPALRYQCSGNLLQQCVGGNWMTVQTCASNNCQTISGGLAGLCGQLTAVTPTVTPTTSVCLANGESCGGVNEPCNKCCNSYHGTTGSQKCGPVSTVVPTITGCTNSTYQCNVHELQVCVGSEWITVKTCVANTCSVNGITGDCVYAPPPAPSLIPTSTVVPALCILPNNRPNGCVCDWDNNCESTSRCNAGICVVKTVVASPTLVVATPTKIPTVTSVPTVKLECGEYLKLECFGMLTVRICGSDGKWSYQSCAYGWLCDSKLNRCISAITPTVTPRATATLWPTATRIPTATVTPQPTATRIPTATPIPAITCKGSCYGVACEQINMMTVSGGKCSGGGYCCTAKPVVVYPTNTPTKVPTSTPTKKPVTIACLSNGSICGTDGSCDQCCNGYHGVAGGRVCGPAPTPTPTMKPTATPVLAIRLGQSCSYVAGGLVVSGTCESGCDVGEIPQRLANGCLCCVLTLQPIVTKVATGKICSSTEFSGEVVGACMSDCGTNGLVETKSSDCSGMRCCISAREIVKVTPTSNVGKSCAAIGYKEGVKGECKVSCNGGWIKADSKDCVGSLCCLSAPQLCYADKKPLGCSCLLGVSCQSGSCIQGKCGEPIGQPTPIIAKRTCGNMATVGLGECFVGGCENGTSQLTGGEWGCVSGEVCCVKNNGQRVVGGGSCGQSETYGVGRCKSNCSSGEVPVGNDCGVLSCCVPEKSACSVVGNTKKRDGCGCALSQECQSGYCDEGNRCSLINVTPTPVVAWRGNNECLDANHNLLGAGRPDGCFCDQPGQCGGSVCSNGTCSSNLCLLDSNKPNGCSCRGDGECQSKVCGSLLVGCSAGRIEAILNTMTAITDIITSTLGLNKK